MLHEEYRARTSSRREGGTVHPHVFDREKKMEEGVPGSSRRSRGRRGVRGSVQTWREELGGTVEGSGMATVVMAVAPL